MSSRACRRSLDRADRDGRAVVAVVLIVGDVLDPGGVQHGTRLGVDETLELAAGGGRADERAIELRTLRSSFAYFQRMISGRALEAKPPRRALSQSPRGDRRRRPGSGRVETAGQRRGVGDNDARLEVSRGQLHADGVDAGEATQRRALVGDAVLRADDRDRGRRSAASWSRAVTVSWLWSPARRHHRGASRPRRPAGDGDACTRDSSGAIRRSPFAAIASRCAPRATSTTRCRAGRAGCRSSRDRAGAVDDEAGCTAGHAVFIARGRASFS